MAFAAAAEITHRGGDCGCWTTPARAGMKIRVTKTRVKRAYGPRRREHERDGGPGLGSVLHADSGDRVLRGLAAGVQLVPGGGPAVRQTVAATEIPADGAGQTAEEGGTPEGPQEAGQQEKTKSERLNRRVILQETRRLAAGIESLAARYDPEGEIRRLIYSKTVLVK